MISNQKLFFSLLLISVSFFLVDYSSSLATEPECDLIEDPTIYEKLILNHPVIMKLGAEFTITHVEIIPCFQGRTVEMMVMYQIPVTDSQSDLIYTDGLYIVYPTEGDGLTFTNLETRQTNPLEYEAISALTQERVQRLQQRIALFERNPRIQEFIEKINVQNKVIPLDVQASSTLVGEGSDRISYKWASNSVLWYTLSHKVEWQHFPKINQSHELVEEKLLRGKFKECVIDDNGYTNIKEPEEAVSLVSVGLSCGAEAKNIAFLLNPDGSYTLRETNTKESDLIADILFYLVLMLGITAFIWGAMKFLKKA